MEPITIVHFCQINRCFTALLKQLCSQDEIVPTYVKESLIKELFETLKN